MRGAEVAVQSDLTGARQKAYCDEQGRFESTELAPGTYKLTVRSEGFRTITQLFGKRIDDLRESLNGRINDLRDSVNGRLDTVEKRLTEIESGFRLVRQ